MKFKQTLLLGYTKENLGSTEWKRLEKLTDEMLLISKDELQFKEKLKTVDCLLVRLGETIDKELINAAPNLRYIGMFGTGYGRIDTVYAKSKGITVCNIAGYSKEGVAELVFGIILEHIRDLERAKSQARDGNFSEATFQGYEIKGKNFGIVGLGRNGRRVAEIAQKGFQAKVYYWSRNRKEDVEREGIQYKELNELLRNSDFLSINVAYVPETKDLLDKERLNKIKPGCIVVSTVQNEVFNFEALVERLKRNDFIFISDHSDELTPEQAKELSKYKNCILYPPVGYITKEATAAKLGMFVDNIENFLKGKPTNKVN